MYLSGKTCTLKVSAVPYPFKDGDLSIQSAFVDTTNSLSGGFQDGVSGIIKGSLHVELLYDPTLAPFVPGASVTIIFGIGATYAITTTALMSDIKYANGMTKAAGASVSFNFVGTWTATFVLTVGS